MSKAKPTRHYEITEWADFVRGLTPENEAAAMRLHLEDGCEACGRLSKFCERVARTAANMVSEDAPETAVRLARAIFPVRTPPPRGRRVVRIALELVFDSFVMPAPAGLRATWQVGWQGLYRAGECSLDLRIEPNLESSRATIIGQICDHAAPETELSNAAVRLRAGREVVAETLSNRFGEFQIEYEQRRGLELMVYLESGNRCLVAPVKRLNQSGEPAPEAGREGPEPETDGRPE